MGEILADSGVVTYRQWSASSMAGRLLTAAFGIDAFLMEMNNNYNVVIVHC